VPFTLIVGDAEEGQRYNMTSFEAIVQLSRYIGVSSVPLNSIEMLNKKYVHKTDPAQVAIGTAHNCDEYAYEVPELRPYIAFYAHAYPNLSCPVCFDHPLDHYPLMCFFEMGRQMSIALMHMFYGIPMKGYFGIAKDLSFQFREFAELDLPLTLFALDKGDFSFGQVVDHRCFEYYFVQQDRVCATGTGEVSFIKAESYRRIRLGMRGRKMRKQRGRLEQGLITNVEAQRLFSRSSERHTRAAARTD